MHKTLRVTEIDLEGDVLCKQWNFYKNHAFSSAIMLQFFHFLKASMSPIVFRAFSKAASARCYFLQI